MREGHAAFMDIFRVANGWAGHLLHGGVRDVPFLPCGERGRLLSQLYERSAIGFVQTGP